MSLGHRGLANPATTLATLLTKREKLQDELRNLEKQVYELETSYLQDSSHGGLVSKESEGASSKNTANLKRSRKLQPEDRFFSLSSLTSQAAEELEAQRDDGRSDFGPAQSKDGGLAANGRGKPKKARTASLARDGKAIK